MNDIRAGPHQHTIALDSNSMQVTELSLWHPNEYAKTASFEAQISSESPGQEA